MSSASAALSAAGTPAVQQGMGRGNARRRFLFSRWLDFLGLGGGSILVLVVMVAFYPKGDVARAILAATMLFLAHFVNHPHFAHSYQLFYRGLMK